LWKKLIYLFHRDIRPVDTHSYAWNNPHAPHDAPQEIPTHDKDVIR